jgi:hypothetical protein
VAASAGWRLRLRSANPTLRKCDRYVANQAQHLYQHRGDNHLNGHADDDDTVVQGRGESVVGNHALGRLREDERHDLECREASERA